MKKLLPLLLSLGLMAAASVARADDDQLCFGPPGKDRAAAAEACTAILRRPILSPEWKVRALIARARAEARLRKFELAMADLNSALAIDPRNTLGLQVRSGIYDIEGKFREALRDTDLLLGIDPNDPHYLNESCWQHAGLWELEAAMADCRKSLAIAPRSAATLDSLGFVQFRLRNYKEALAAYDAALAIAPRQAASLYVRGVIKRKLGNLVEGDADMRAAAKISSDIAEYFVPFGLTQGN